MKIKEYHIAYKVEKKKKKNTCVFYKKSIKLNLKWWKVVSSGAKW